MATCDEYENEDGRAFTIQIFRNEKWRFDNDFGWNYVVGLDLIFIYENMVKGDVWNCNRDEVYLFI